MRKLFAYTLLGFAFFLALPTISTAQDVLNGVYTKERDKNRKPVPYRPLIEADVAWEKMVWRMIDLREKQNLPLYSPTIPIQERMSLIDLLLSQITNGELLPYNPDFPPGQEFLHPMLEDEVIAKFDGLDDTVATYDPDTGEETLVPVPGEIKSYEVKQYIIKEHWYFDRKYSSLNVRIVGFCPIREYVEETGDDMSAASQALVDDNAGEVSKAKMFWVPFKNIRPFLANHEVFNVYNDAERRTFDDIFFKRRFSGFIVQESNVYDNRNINDFSLGQRTLEEAERIKKRIFTYEQDLWEY